MELNKLVRLLINVNPLQSDLSLAQRSSMMQTRHIVNENKDVFFNLFCDSELN